MMNDDLQALDQILEEINQGQQVLGGGGSGAVKATRVASDISGAAGGASGVGVVAAAMTPTTPVGSPQKETFAGGASREYNFAAAEAPPQPETQKDQEKIQELETAIESYMQKNQSLAQNQNAQIAIGAGQKPLAASAYQNQPTIVLPITEEQEKIGARQAPIFSLRWLTTLVGKLKKMFQGRFTYKNEAELAAPPPTSPNPPTDLSS